MKTRTVLAGLALALLAFAVLPALTAQEEEESIDAMIQRLRARLAEREGKIAPKPVAFLQHVYDVRDLVTPVRDRPGESIDLVPSGGFGFGFSEEEGLEAMPFYEGDMLVDMVVANVAPGSWDELTSVSVYYENGFLVVKHTAGVHERIARLLEQLRGRAAAQITVGVRWLSIPDAELRKVLGAGSRTVLDEAAEKRLDAAIAAGRATVVARGSLTGVNTQRVSLTDVNHVSYVQDYDVEIAQAATMADPIIQLAPEGTMVDVRATVAGRGDIAVMEVRAETGKLERPMATAPTKIGAIDTPDLRIMKVWTMLAVPIGRSVVVGGMLDNGPARSLMLVLTPLATRSGAK